MSLFQASVILLVFLVQRTILAPTTEDENTYDQRQNGTNNLQIEIDNIVIMHSPIPMQTLLAMLDNAPTDLAMLQQVVQAAEKPATTTEKGDLGESSSFPSEMEEGANLENVKIAHDGKRKNRPRLGLGAFLAPLLGFTKNMGVK